jgi:hypothetical protein
MISSSPIWATTPCSTIYKACRDAGFYLGGGDVGKGIVYNCMMPIVDQEKLLPNTNFDKLTLTMCYVWLHDKFRK